MVKYLLFIGLLAVRPAGAQTIDPFVKLRVAVQGGVTDHAGNERAAARRAALVEAMETEIARESTPEARARQASVLASSITPGGPGVAAARRFFDLRRAGAAAAPSVARILETNAVTAAAATAVRMCAGRPCDAAATVLDITVAAVPARAPLVRLVGGRPDRLLAYPMPGGRRLPPGLLERPAQAAAAAATCTSCGNVATAWAVDGANGIGVVAATQSGVAFVNSATNRATTTIGAGALRRMMRGGNPPGTVRSAGMSRGDVVDALQRGLSVTPIRH